MQGKHFGAGLAVGILMALVVVAGSSALSPGTSGVTLNLDFAHSPVNAPGATATTTFTGATTTSTSARQAENTSQGSSQVPGTTNATTTTSYGPVTTTTPSPPATSSQGQPGQFDFVGAVVNQPSSSMVGSLPGQALSLDALVILPVLIALILGAVLYRASRRDRTD